MQDHVLGIVLGTVEEGLVPVGRTGGFHTCALRGDGTVWAEDWHGLNALTTYFFLMVPAFLLLLGRTYADDGEQQARAVIRDEAELPPRTAFKQLVMAHLHTLHAPDHDFIAVLLYEWRSLDQPNRARIIKLKDRHEAIWDAVIAALHRSGDWAMPTRLDRLLMFGAMNWSAQWYKPGAGGVVADGHDGVVAGRIGVPMSAFGYTTRATRAAAPDNASVECLGSRAAPTPNSASTQDRIRPWVQPMARRVPASLRRLRT